jgi:hypothetical protein
VQVPKEKQTFEKFTDANKFASIANQRIWPKSAFLTWQTLLCSIKYLVLHWLSRSEGRGQHLFWQTAQMANGLYSGIVTVLTITGYSMAKDKPACGHRWWLLSLVAL